MPPMPPMPASLRLLLVEDSADDAELVLMELRRGGFAPEHLRVATAAAMTEALAARSWDLVLSDYRMPGYGGMDALRALQASGMDLPFILVSGAIGEEVAVAAMKAGAHDYVSKHNLARLCPAVARELKDAAARGEQRQAKEDLRRSEERYRALFEDSPIPMAVDDFSQVLGVFERCRREGVQDFRAHFEAHPGLVRECARAVVVRESNQARSRFYSGDDPERQADGFGAMFQEDSWPVFLDLLVSLAGGALSWQGEMPIQGAGGSAKVIDLHLSVSPGFERSFQRMLISFTDATGRIQMEAALRDLDRISAKGQMAAYIAHEINNPLAGIKNAFALLEPAIPLDHPHRRYADLIKREIDRIAGIIRTMYHVYRPPSGEQGDVGLEEVFEDIQSLLAPKCRNAGVTLTLGVEEKNLAVRCNGGMLRQVIFNLAQNAVEASPRAGTVVLGAARSGAATEITVRDQGAGIPPEWAEQVFKQGFTTKDGSGMSGLGLGLSTCKSIVESMGGTLAFHSRAGLGCTFRVELPAAGPGRAG